MLLEFEKFQKVSVMLLVIKKYFKHTFFATSFKIQ